jgi:hypothetical protein
MLDKAVNLASGAFDSHPSPHLGIGAPPHRICIRLVAAVEHGPDSNESFIYQGQGHEEGHSLWKREYRQSANLWSLTNSVKGFLFYMTIPE